MINLLTFNSHLNLNTIFNKDREHNSRQIITDSFLAYCAAIDLLAEPFSISCINSPMVFTGLRQE